MNDERRETLLTAIYATIRAPDTWPELIKRIGDWLGADSGLMLASPAAQTHFPIPHLTYGMDPTPIMSAFPANIERAPLTQRALATGRAPGCFLLDELMPPEEQRVSPFWQSVLAPLDVTSGILGIVRTPDDNSRPVVISFFRRGERPKFGDGQAAHFEGLFPDLRRALAVALDAPPRRVASDVTDAYDAIAAPVFLIGTQGEVLYANVAARRFLDQDKGVVIRDDHLSIADEDAQNQLDELLPRVIGGNFRGKPRTGADLLVKGLAPGPASVFVLTPVGGDNQMPLLLQSPIRCAIFVLEEMHRVDASLPVRLRRLYGLTSAESDVCLDIAAGLSPSLIAAQRGTAIATVRAQLKSALAKTGSTRQLELAALVHRLRF